MSRPVVNAEFEDELIADLSSLDLDPPNYSHTATVKAITSFYEFISRMHPVGVADIEYPPATGWPQITQNLFSPPPSPAVLKLLQHIPYLTDCPCIMNHTRPVNYLDETLYGTSTATSNTQTSPESDEDIPPHIVELACSGNRYGYDILIDTVRGVVYWGVKDGDYLPTDLPPPDADSFEQGEMENTKYSWRTMPAYRINTFFEMCKEQFRILNWYPLMDDLGHGEVWQLSKHQKFDEEEGERARVMRDCGWPGDGQGRGWDRERAEQETEAWQTLRE